MINLDFYVIKSLSCAEEYIVLEGDIASIKRPCIKSEYQFLDSKKMCFSISDEGGLEIPDILYQDGIWFVSKKVKNIFDDYGIDYLFYKKAEIISEKFGIYENFWIIVPPRIDCLDIDNSIFEKEWDFDDGVIPCLDAEKIIISPKLAGHFEIFRILGINDNNIYISSGLNDVLSGMGLSGFTSFIINNNY